MPQGSMHPGQIESLQQLTAALQAKRDKQRQVGISILVMYSRTCVVFKHRVNCFNCPHLGGQKGLVPLLPVATYIP